MTRLELAPLTSVMSQEISKTLTDWTPLKESAWFPLRLVMAVSQPGDDLIAGLSDLISHSLSATLALLILIGYF